MCRTFFTPIRKWKHTAIRVTFKLKEANGIILEGGVVIETFVNSEESFGLKSRVGPGHVLLFRLVGFWTGCRSCPRTRPVETCAGIVRSEPEGVLPLCNKEQRGKGWNETRLLTFGHRTHSWAGWQGVRATGPGDQSADRATSTTHGSNNHLKRLPVIQMTTLRTRLTLIKGPMQV